MVFFQRILEISPDHEVYISRNVLEERDGPMLPIRVFLEGSRADVRHPLGIGRAPPGAAGGSGCYELRFASVLRTASGLRPAAPSASLTRVVRRGRCRLHVVWNSDSLV